MKSKIDKTKSTVCEFDIICCLYQSCMHQVDLNQMHLSSIAVKSPLLLPCQLPLGISHQLSTLCNSGFGASSNRQGYALTMAV